MKRSELGWILVVVALAAGTLAGSAGLSFQTTTRQSDATRLVASDAAANSELGESVSVFASTVVVGAPGDDDEGINTGSAYLFVFDGDEWEEEQEIFASDARDNDSFGWSVSISEDTAIVGSIFGDDGFDRTGSAYVFVRGRRGWEQQDELVPSNGKELDQFGHAVSISGDTVVIGSPYARDLGLSSGSTYVFERSGSRWSEEDRLLPHDGGMGDGIGFSVALDADTVLVGAPDADDSGSSSGTAYVFVRDRGRWDEEDKLLAGDGKAGDQFGYSLAIDGDTAVIGAPNADGNVGLSGAAYVFIRDGEDWTEHSKLASGNGGSEDGFGNSVSISGDYIIVGAPENEGAGMGSGAAYLFVRTDDTWIEREQLLPFPAFSDTLFGQSVSVSADIALAGSPGAADNGPASGAAYAFDVDYIFILTVTQAGTGTGYVSSTPPGIDCGPDCSEEFAIDTEVTLGPTPDSDSVFAGWTGDEDCTDDTVTMTGDMTCTAEFTLRSHTLSVLTSGTGSGTVTSNPSGIDCQPDCEEIFTFGTEVALEAEPEPGSVFGGWSGDPDCTDGRVAMVADRACDAAFLTDGVFSDGFESGDLSAWELDF